MKSHNPYQQQLDLFCHHWLLRDMDIHAEHESSVCLYDSLNLIVSLAILIMAAQNSLSIILHPKIIVSPS